MRNPEVSRMLYNQTKAHRETQKLANAQPIIKKLASLAIRQPTQLDANIVYEAIEELERLQSKEVD